LNNQKGSVSLIVIIFITIIISTITVSTNVSFIFSQKRNLQELIDQAALAGVQQIDQSAYYQTGLAEEIQIDKVKATIEVQEFISKNSNFDDEIILNLRFNQSEISISGEVLISPPLASNLVKFPVRASASARFVVGF